MQNHLINQLCGTQAVSGSICGQIWLGIRKGERGSGCQVVLHMNPTVVIEKHHRTNIEQISKDTVVF